MSVRLRPLTRLYGRSEDVTRLIDLLGSPSGRLVTLTGLSGVGKTRLAAEVARRFQNSWRQRAWVVGLDAVSDPAEIHPAVAAAIGVRTAAGQEMLGAIRDRIGRSPALLVIDNVAHLKAAAPALSQLVEACPRLRILSTSVCSLRTSGEHVLPVDPLPVPTGDTAVLGALSGQPAVAMFTDWAARTGTGFTLSARNVAAVVAVCGQLGGLPLALEMAAARVAVLPVEALAEQLAGPRALEILARGRADAPDRHQSMSAAIGWAYLLLGDSQRRMLQRLSPLEGAFSLDVAESMAFDPAARATVLDTLSDLVESRFVEPAVAGPLGQARFALTPLVRRFVRDQVARAAEAEGPRRPRAMRFDVAPLGSSVEAGPPVQEPGTMLTPRERQVLSLIARGETNKEIGRQLSLSTKTVMHHTVAIYRKLEVRGRSEATAWALRHGIDDGDMASQLTRLAGLMPGGHLPGYRAPRPVP